MDLLEDLKRSLLGFNFVMNYIIHKMLVLLKNHLNYLKYSILKSFLRSIIDFYLFIYLSIKEKEIHNIVLESLSLDEENIIKDIRNIFRIKIGLIYPIIKDIKNLFRLEKSIKVIKDRILRDIKNLFVHEEEKQNHYKPVSVSNF